MELKRYAYKQDLASSMELKRYVHKQDLETNKQILIHLLVILQSLTLR